MTERERMDLEKTLLAMKRAASRVWESVILIESVVGPSKATQDIRNNAYDLGNWADQALTFTAPETEPRQD